MRQILKNGVTQYLGCDLCGNPDLGSTYYSLDIDLCGDCMWDLIEDLP